MGGRAAPSLLVEETLEKKIWRWHNDWSVDKNSKRWMPSRRACVSAIAEEEELCGRPRILGLCAKPTVSGADTRRGLYRTALRICGTTLRMPGP